MFTPLYWFLIFLLLSFFIQSKRWKRIFGFLTVSFFFLFSSPILYQIYARWWQPKPVSLPENSHYSFAIIAGGFASVDMNGEGYFNTASDRFIQAMKLYRSGAVDHLLISGGNSRDKDKKFTEAAWAKGEMIKMGIPGSVIFIEDKSTSTEENAVNSKRVLDSLHAQPPFVLITSAFHIPRAEKIFQNKGMKVIAYPCNYTEGRGPLSAKDLIPNVGLMIDWNKYIKESIWWMVKGYFLV